ncbi:hypothetical protein C7999DRAFT_16217 [Corynascus novoguineensis]|uniref:Uncharacterized protein n=1 Tax=Corynascus novoguineensis TaxID=1126955 RepID=A0AAN7CQX9_9PEZI|nr:hypothetical protein C7999DRAFT_16217 [Corynascus novoguineensis]
MDAQSANDSKDWISLYIETVQSERQKREEHTVDIEESIQQYTAAARDKIRAAQGLGHAVPLPNGTETLEPAEQG